MIVFAQDVMLSKPEQEKARKRMFEKIKGMGFENAGVEFLFIQTKETERLEKLERRARHWKRFLEKNFAETRFSVHAPWVPAEDTSLLKSREGVERAKALASFCDDFVDIVNLHIDTSMQAKEWRENFSTTEQRDKARERVSERLAELTDTGTIISAEVIPVVEEESLGECLGFLGCMPGDFEFYFKKNRKLGITVDTCHTGITIEACKQIAENAKWFDGFYAEDMGEIKALAKNRDLEFMRLGKRIVHLHYSDLSKFTELSKASHGAVPGKGHRSEKEMIAILEGYKKAVGKKSFSAVLEINETDYTRLVNTEKTFSLLKSYQYY